MVRVRGEIYTQVRRRETCKEYSGVTCEKIKTLHACRVQVETCICNIGYDVYHVLYMNLGHIVISLVVTCEILWGKDYMWDIETFIKSHMYIAYDILEIVKILHSFNMQVCKLILQRFELAACVSVLLCSYLLISI